MNDFANLTNDALTPGPARRLLRNRKPPRTGLKIALGILLALALVVGAGLVVAKYPSRVARSLGQPPTVHVTEICRAFQSDPGSGEGYRGRRVTILGWARWHPPLQLSLDFAHNGVVIARGLPDETGKADLAKLFQDSGATWVELTITGTCTGQSPAGLVEFVGLRLTKP